MKTDKNNTFMFKVTNSTNYGFTLVEIIVVIAVISILTAIIVPSALKHIDSSKADECEINKKALVSLLNSARDLAPDKAMQDIINENPDIACPSTIDAYEATGKDTIRCPYHDAENTAQSNDFEIAGVISPTVFTETEIASIPQNTVPTLPTVENEPSLDDTSDKKSGVDYYEVEDINGNKIKFSCETLQDFAEQYIDDHKSYLKSNAGNGIDTPYLFNKVYLDEETNNIYIQCYTGTIRVSFHHQNDDIKYIIYTHNSPQINPMLKIINYTDNLTPIPNSPDYNINPLSPGQIVKGPDGNYYVAIKPITNYYDYKTIIDAQTNSEHYAWRRLDLY